MKQVTLEEILIVKNQMKCMLCMSDQPSIVCPADKGYRAMCEKCNAVGPIAPTVSIASMVWDEFMKTILEIRETARSTVIRP